MDLPKKERSFYFKYTGEDSGFVYEGQFTIKCTLNIGEKRLMELEMSRLQGDMQNGTSQLRAISSTISMLRAKIVDAPEWWKQGGGMFIEDEGCLVDLINKVDEVSDLYRKELMAKASPSKEAEPGN